MKLSGNNGLYKYDFELSNLERKLTCEFEDMLEKKGFKYLKVPSIQLEKNLARQEINVLGLRVGENLVLTGSAEQGILEYFADSKVEEMNIFSTNQCFRHEFEYDNIKYFRDFTKIEQFAFVKPENFKKTYMLFLRNVTDFLDQYNIEYRIINTSKDSGYHKLKHDIEILYQGEWIETHSLTYFGNEQTKRFGITGGCHTISCTGLAFPRILLAFLDKNIK